MCSVSEAVRSLLVKDLELYSNSSQAGNENNGNVMDLKAGRPLQTKINWEISGAILLGIFFIYLL